MLDKIMLANKLNKAKSEVDKIRAQVFAVKEKGNVRVVVRGDNKIEKIEIDGQEDKDMKNMINDAFKEVEKKADKKIKSQAADSPMMRELAGMLGK